MLSHSRPPTPVASPARPPRGLRARAALTVAALAAALIPAAGVAAAPARAATPPAAPSDATLAAQPARHADTHEQFYFVMPDRFANGDKGNDKGGLVGSRLSTGFDPTDKGFYQGGDLKGLTKKLDYIKGLGTTAIWMAPIFKNKPVQGTGKDASAGYHGYWITDFTKVDPHFGTNADLRKLISAAHAKGMKVFFDVITNHTADVIGNTQNTYDYLSKGAFPYLTKDGVPFDDSDYADGTKGFPKVSSASFPYTPSVPADEQDEKVPAWLNDPTMYHNRGNTTNAGESADQGDFSGLDDLWTERPEVVHGMEKIYEKWVRDYDVDGFRIDTAKNVDMPFWTQWATALDNYAAAHGRKNFFLFGETYDSDPAVTSPYVTQGRLDATLDFPFQQAAREYASQGAPASSLANVLGQDYRYTDDKSNAYEEVTFLGNHDMGRIGYFLKTDNPKASDAELLRKDELANDVMFLSRGNPVVYYGDEQGFTGAGGDKDARQPMFGTKIADYDDQPEIGTTRTATSSAYDTSHPLYRDIAALSKLRRANPALTDGVQVERYAATGAGVYAFSRTDPKQRVEYVVALNNATTDQSVQLPTYAANARYTRIYGGGQSAAATVTAADRTMTVDVPAESAVVYRADRALPAAAKASTAKPGLTVTAPAAGATGTVTVSAAPKAADLSRVVFAAQVGNATWQVLGSADHAPYQVTQTLKSSVPAGTTVRYKAVVVDTSGRTGSATATTVTGAPATTAPPTAEQHDYVVVHYKRTDGDYDGWQLYAWGDIADGEATTWPDGHAFTGRDAYGAFAWVKLKPGATSVGFIVEKDGVKDGDADRTIDVSQTGEVWLTQGSPDVLTSAPDGAYPPQSTSTAIIHYHRADGNYDGWGLHVWTGAKNPTDWSTPLQPTGHDAYGDIFEVPLADGATSLSYIIHNGDTKDLPDDQSLDLTSTHEVWLLDGTSGHLLPEETTSPSGLDLTTSDAQWIDRDTVAWKTSPTAAASYQLVYDPKGQLAVNNGILTGNQHWLRLEPVAGGLTAAQLARFPQLKGYSAFTVDPRDRSRVRTALTGQVIATQRLASGALYAATGVQTQGVLDDLGPVKAHPVKAHGSHHPGVGKAS